MNMNAQEYLGDAFNPETGELNLERAKEIINDRRGKINIVLMGATGVGKSSLINAVFGKDVVEAGAGKPVTKGLKKIEVKEKGLTLWDTQGIEAKDYEATTDQLQKDIDDGLQTALENEDNKTFPHVAWLCIKETSSRIQPSDLDLLKMTKKFGIPTVVVFTDTRGESGDEFIVEAKKIIDDEFKDIIKDRYARVNSCEYKFMGMTVPVSGLEDLLEFTVDCLDDAENNTKQQRQIHKEAFLKAQEVDMQKKLDAMVKSAKAKVHIASAAAGTVGASPIPGSDAPLIAAIQGTLIHTLNSEFKVDEESNKITSAITGILSTTAVAQVGKTVVANILKIIPGFGTVVGGAVSASTAVALTEAIGQAYIKVLQYYFDKDVGKSVLPKEELEMVDRFKGIFKEIYKDNANNNNTKETEEEEAAAVSEDTPKDS